MLTNELLKATDFVTDREFTARPLEHKGLNKHFLNLLSADVFVSRKKNIFDIFKAFFN
ncbi:MAG: hypothetical protein ACI37Z_06060 [Candidatus Gastranaerophilaceae bacterium]